MAWLVLRTKYGEEAAVAASLASDLAIDAYCPLFSKWRKLPRHIAKSRGQSRELIQVPLITGYVFARCERLPSLPADLARKVYGPLVLAYRLCYASDHEVEILRGHQEAKEARPEHIVRDIDPQSLVGQLIAVSGGPLAGLKFKAAGVRAGGVLVEQGAFKAVVPVHQVRLAA